jgi:CxxC motif-containing protein (DUF1111 family)
VKPSLVITPVMLAAALLCAACSRTDETAEVVVALDPVSPLAAARTSESGGAATVHDDSPDAFALAVPDLTRAQRRAFAVGNSFFNDAWVVAPASAEGRDGLGPLFNATNCSGCHFRDGRGRPPERVGDPLESMLVRLSVAQGDSADTDACRTVPHPVYGDQFQDKAIPGVPKEVAVRITYAELPGRYADGMPYSLRRPTVELTDLGYGPLGERTLISARVAPAVFGVGLIEAIPDARLVALEQRQYQDPDGVSGRVRWVSELRSGARRAGRFGWKAGAATIEQQSSLAFAGDIGITSHLVPRDHATVFQTAALAAPNGGVPELSDHKLERVVEYQRTLAVPARRNVDDPRVQRGQGLFLAARCDACHVPEQTTGTVPDLPALSQQTITPYSDFLLHDMGSKLADHRPEGDLPDGAGGREWRTPPLWGVGLIQTVNKHALLLHDGRARGVAEAILWHGGEAKTARERFRCLPADDRAALIAFVESL